MKGVTLPTETVFVMENSPINLGPGAMDEIGLLQLAGVAPLIE